MQAMQSEDVGRGEMGKAAREAATRLVAARRRAVSDYVAPLRAEADRVAEEITTLSEAARRIIWETIVQTRDIHARICDAHARLEHLQLDIREQTGEVRLPSVPTPFVDFLVSEIRRFVVTTATVDLRAGGLEPCELDEPRAVVQGRGGAVTAG